MLLSEKGHSPLWLLPQQFPSMKIMWLVSTVRISAMSSLYNCLSGPFVFSLQPLIFAPPNDQLGSLMRSYPAIIGSFTYRSANFFQSAFVFVRLAASSHSEGFVAS